MLTPGVLKITGPSSVWCWVHEDYECVEHRNADGSFDYSFKGSRRTGSAIGAGETLIWDRVWHANAIMCKAFLNAVHPV